MPFMMVNVRIVLGHHNHPGQKSIMIRADHLVHRQYICRFVTVKVGNACTAFSMNFWSRQVFLANTPSTIRPSRWVVRRMNGSTIEDFTPSWPQPGLPCVVGGCRYSPALWLPSSPLTPSEFFFTIRNPEVSIMCPFGHPHMFTCKRISAPLSYLIPHSAQCILI